ncbi:hypothetical protein U1E44_12605 [Arenibacter sp. GZD96]|uniref:hypothetical protein n=1 Tax=Aurantibrevibacter litoralis TaxID=3106030 RepID=UPI002AFE569B|nr:hypothetical protein [Arenibacter sp. GZD-96]MEA1786935.1 hypothetical protein [Arenibacter sp. GZD-96]
MKKLQSKNGFKIPEGYFENVSERILHTIEHTAQEKPNEGFKVPANYFDHLDQRILKRLEPPKGKLITHNAFTKYYYAAVAIAAIFLVFFGLNKNPVQNAIFDFEDLSFSDIETYFETNEFGFTSYEIAEMIPVDQLEINDVLVNELLQENVIDYLYNNTDNFEEFNLENND